VKKKKSSLEKRRGRSVVSISKNVSKEENLTSYLRGGKGREGQGERDGKRSPAGIIRGA